MNENNITSSTVELIKILKEILDSHEVGSGMRNLANTAIQKAERQVDRQGREIQDIIALVMCAGENDKQRAVDFLSGAMRIFPEMGKLKSFQELAISDLGKFIARKDWTNFEQAVKAIKGGAK